ncbi:DUF4189 domain-containing protein [Variovorax sp. J2P1-59]|uniref:DUF4189 domain-containing protein n=1 Tax=Variovorax flavidus TaxID=3053501 RepID=UPI002576A63C|nr:DUF4189 domain-containing protein [Variovorax sp. J2P1-59]MDM0074620.1 DUF4189 domain-containing protein [Variovorax sp. J2P1-59]
MPFFGSLVFGAAGARSACLTLGLALLCSGLPVRAGAAPAEDPGPSWGAIASKAGWYGYSYNHASRSAAERAARAQCDRAARRADTCEVRAYFDRSCGALAAGNYGEWATATASTAKAAGLAAVGQCDLHLPTEPCKVVVSVCSPP